MRSQIIRFTDGSASPCAIERAYGWCWHTERQHAEPAIESDRRPVPMWRQRATDPDSVGVSDRFRVTAVDMTGRLVVRP